VQKAYFIDRRSRIRSLPLRTHHRPSESIPKQTHFRFLCDVARNASADRPPKRGNEKNRPLFLLGGNFTVYLMDGHDCHICQYSRFLKFFCLISIWDWNCLYYFAGVGVFLLVGWQCQLCQRQSQINNNKITQKHGNGDLAEHFYCNRTSCKNNLLYIFLFV
jgi:hypothetical protein